MRIRISIFTEVVIYRINCLLRVFLKRIALKVNVIIEEMLNLKYLNVHLQIFLKFAMIDHNKCYFKVIIKRLPTTSE